MMFAVTAALIALAALSLAVTLAGTVVLPGSLAGLLAALLLGLACFGLVAQDRDRLVRRARTGRSLRTVR